jgi:hypothetical protein
MGTIYPVAGFASVLIEPLIRVCGLTGFPPFAMKKQGVVVDKGFARRRSLLPVAK